MTDHGSAETQQRKRHALHQLELGFHLLPVWGTQDDGTCRCPAEGNCAQKPGKHPVTEHGFKDAVDDPAKVRTFLKSGNNYGIVWPEGGPVVFILDIDGDGWQDHLNSLEDQHGPLPATMTTTTPSGGMHAFYEWPVEAGDPPSGNLFDFVTRWPWKGYVVGPGSRIGDRAYTTNGTDDIATFPIAWAKAALAGKAGTKGSTRPQDGQKVPEGQRHDYLRDRAFALHKQGLADEGLFDAVMALNLDHCDPPKDEEGVRRAIGEVESKFDPDPIGPAPEDQQAWQRLAGDTKHGGEFAAEVVGRVLFDTAAKQFYVYQGHRWRPDRRQNVKRMFRRYLGKRLKAAALFEDETVRAAALKSIMAASRTDSRINGAVRMASIDLSVEGDEWDADPWLLGVQNGVLDLRTAELRDGRPEDYITKSTSCAYVPEAQAPLFQRFLREVFLGDEELIDWLQLKFGYTATGLNEAETFGLCYGDGENGKSTLLGAIGNVMGMGRDGYTVTVNTDVVIGASRSGGAGPNEEVAALQGARLALAIEAEQDMVLSDAKAKKLASSERLRASRKFQHDREWDATHTLFVALNRLPQVNDNSAGIWRRIALIPFHASFPPGARDDTLKERLTSESEGILVWMVEGAKRYATKRSLFPRPSAVEVATAEYRESEDHVGRFISECVTYVSGSNVGASEAYRLYATWCGANRIGKGPRWTTQYFGNHFAARVSSELRTSVEKVPDRTKTFFYEDVRISLDEALQEDAGGRFQTSSRKTT